MIDTYASLLDFQRKIIESEIMRQEAEIEYFLVSGAMPRDLVLEQGCPGVSKSSICSAWTFNIPFRII